MRLRKVLITVFCIAFAMTFSTPAISGSGAIEMTFDKTKKTGYVVESDDPTPNKGWYECANMKIKKVQHRGWAFVTACGTAIFNDPSEQLEITLSTESNSLGPRKWVVEPGQSLEQSFCIHMGFRVQKQHNKTFYVNGRFLVEPLAELNDIEVVIDYMTAEVFKSNKVDLLE